MGIEMRGAVGDEIDALWHKHGGTHHGPHIETVVMPLSRFGAFIRELRETPRPPLSEALINRVAELLEHRISTCCGMNGSERSWYVRDFAIESCEGDTFAPLAGPFDTWREAETAAKRVRAKQIVDAVLEEQG